MRNLCGADGVTGRCSSPHARTEGMGAQPGASFAKQNDAAVNYDTRMNIFSIINKGIVECTRVPFARRMRASTLIR